MAKEEKKEEKEESGNTKSNKKLLVIILPCLLFLLAASGAGAYYMLVVKDKAKSQQESSLTETSPKASSKRTLGPLVEMEEFVVNVLDEDDMRFLKAAITLEAADDDSKEEIKKRMPQIRDAVLLKVSNKKFNELRDLQGKLQLRAELIKRINDLLNRGRVRSIFFTDFVVQ